MLQQQQQAFITHNAKWKQQEQLPRMPVPVKGWLISVELITNRWRPSTSAVLTHQLIYVEPLQNVQEERSVEKITGKLNKFNINVDLS